MEDATKPIAADLFKDLKEKEWYINNLIKILIEMRFSYD